MMDQAFGHIPDSIKHEHVSSPEARFAAGTYLCTVCIGRALVMTLTRAGEAVGSDRINAALDRLRDEPATAPGAFGGTTFG